jgi:hypothetical protein
MSITELITSNLHIATSAWTAAAMIGSAVVGSATAIYGANKSAKAQQDATAANKASQDETNRLNYQRWLESQGVGANGQPINTWLPRYAMITKPNVEVPSGFSLFSKPKYGTASVGANGVVNPAMPATGSAMSSNGAAMGGAVAGRPATVDPMSGMPESDPYNPFVNQ